MALNFMKQVHCAAVCVEKINTARQNFTPRILKLKVSHVRSPTGFSRGAGLQTTAQRRVMVLTLSDMNVSSVAWSAASVMLRRCNNSSAGTETIFFWQLQLFAIRAPTLSIVNASLVRFAVASGAVARSVGMLRSATIDPGFPRHRCR